MKYRNYIWDLDGTLLDSYGVMVSSIHDAFAQLGAEFPPEEIHSFIIRHTVGDYFTVKTAETGISRDIVYPIYAQFSDSRKNGITLISNAKETLDGLSLLGARHFVFTHRGANAEYILKNLGIYNAFEEILTSKSGFAWKPAPDAVNYLIGRYGLKPEETCYVGDRTIDVDCAKNAGIGGILYLPEGSYCIPDGSETETVTDLSEIPELK